MTSPFAQAHTMFLVLVSPTGQYSIWPAVLRVPAGWQVVHGVASRLSCEAFAAAARLDLSAAA
ncbi:MbtH family protein [Lentzea aerocolonigenes]|uniref:MbtH family protein n=1 Tax=Lentzea aerocolonigenes TaxID=68170 RepID=UPI0004C2D6E2|nr:MbtH family protein [Lentzea aerocolonigenes]